MIDLARKPTMHGFVRVRKPSGPENAVAMTGFPKYIACAMPNQRARTRCPAKEMLTHYSLDGPTRGVHRWPYSGARTP